MKKSHFCQIEMNLSDGPIIANWKKMIKIKAPRYLIPLFAFLSLFPFCNLGCGEKIARNSTISGTISIEDNIPLNQVEITLLPTWEKTTPDSYGQYCFSSIKKGNYSIMANMEGYGVLSGPFSIENNQDFCFSPLILKGHANLSLFCGPENWQGKIMPLNLSISGQGQEKKTITKLPYGDYSITLQGNLKIPKNIDIHLTENRETDLGEIMLYSQNSPEGKAWLKMIDGDFDEGIRILEGAKNSDYSFVPEKTSYNSHSSINFLLTICHIKNGNIKKAIDAFKGSAVLTNEAAYLAIGLYLSSGDISLLEGFIPENGDILDDLPLLKQGGTSGFEHLKPCNIQADPARFLASLSLLARLKSDQSKANELLFDARSMGLENWIYTAINQ